jgi:hypothetical protein
MTNRTKLGGVVYRYQKYDPREFPSPTQPPPDMVSSAFEHMLAYGSMRELTEEEMARRPTKPDRFKSKHKSVTSERLEKPNPLRLYVSDIANVLTRSRFTILNDFGMRSTMMDPRLPSISFV